MSKANQVNQVNQANQAHEMVAGEWISHPGRSSHSNRTISPTSLNKSNKQSKMKGSTGNDCSLGAHFFLARFKVGKKFRGGWNKKET